MGGGAHRPGLRQAPAAARPPAILVAGPTASGKSGLALAVAREFGGLVINADSMQVYRELSILTARPGETALAAAPHRLYGVLSAAERCSAGRWRALAGDVAAETAGRLPVFVGGTGLYLRTLTRGLADIPPVPAPVAAEGAALLARGGPAALHAQLRRLDPVMAQRVAPGDSQRVLRAWAVRQGTGRSLADWQADSPVRDGWPSLTLALMPPRDALYAACDNRFRRMVEAGAMEEAQALAALRLDPSLPAMRAVGVRELIAASEGRISLCAAIDAAQQATRRYAKRQMTWIRHQMPEAEILTEQFSERILPKIFNIIRQFLLTAPG